MSKLTLYNIMEEHQLLLQNLEETEGELTPELEEALNLNKEDFEAKAVSYGYMVKHFEDNSDTIAAEIKRLTALKKSSDGKAESLRFRIDQAMKTFGFDKIEKNNLKLFFRKSTVCVIEDETLIPITFMKVIPEQHVPDKAAIKSAIDSDQVVPGASLEEKKNLQIK